MVKHRGGCHCGRVRFDVVAPARVQVTECNCSMCSRSGYLHLIVPKERFKLVSGAEALTLYQFNTGTARHLFCSVCGVKSFYVPRSHPDGYSVNARCLDEGTLEDMTIVRKDGKNWEKAYGVAHSILVVPIGEEHVDGLRAAVDSVARERRYLALLEAPPEADTRKYVRDNIAQRVPHFVAIADGKVVGWCDIAVRPRPTQRHSGILGMGVISGYRGKGIGRALMQGTLAAAKASGIRRVELTVRVDNEPARRLYESFGFVTEALCKRHMRVDGEFVDSWLMALLA